MDSGAVLAKTTKGIEEMKTRAHGLPPNVRALLIIIDGRTSVGELVEKLGGAAEPGLQTLLDQGYVETAGEPPAQPEEAAEPVPDKPSDQIDLGGG